MKYSFRVRSAYLDWWFWNSPNAEHAQKIGYSLAELSRKLVTWWSIMREDWSQVGWACAKTSSVHHVHFQSFLLSSSCQPFLCPLLPSLNNLLCPVSPFSRLCSLAEVLCTLSHVICPLSPNLLHWAYARPYCATPDPTELRRTLEDNLPGYEK